LKAHVLHIEQEEDFAVLGIVCTKDLVRLTWELNRFFEIDLVRHVDIIDKTGKTEKQFACCVYINQDQVREIVLIKNKCTDGQWIPALRQLDYFLIEKCGYGDYSIFEKDLNRTSFVQYCSEIDIDPFVIEDMGIFEI